jgi:hypothetical protein
MKRSSAPLPAPARRRVLSTALALAAAVSAPRALAAARTRIDVWKSPACGCCEGWIAHLRAAGFEVAAHDEGNTDARARLGMPLAYGSCHTGEVAGYALEGHVPADEVRRLLQERPDAVGLAVPAMPVGSPGMDGPEYGGRHDPYDVLLVRRDGRASVYRAYR